MIGSLNTNDGKKISALPKIFTLFLINNFLLEKWNNLSKHATEVKSLIF